MVSPGPLTSPQCSEEPLRGVRVIGNITQVRLCSGRTPLQTMLRLQQVAGQVVQAVPGDIS